MKRFLVLLALAAVAALGIRYAYHGATRASASSAAVTALLPKETLALVYLPDLKKSRAQWHETDLYKLWREPAVQDFLKKPLERTAAAGGARQRLQELDALEMKDAFLAVIAFENPEPKILGGFRFRGTTTDAEKVIGQWRARLQETLPGTKREKIDHQGRTIDVIGKDGISAATVYDRDWFFAGNDVANLKMLLDRADKRVTDNATALAADEEFVSAIKHMPGDYAALAFARPGTWVEKLTAGKPTAQSQQMSALRQIRSFAAATTFAAGKIRDVLFVGMPKPADEVVLTRSSLALASKESFLYLASILNFPDNAALPDPQAPAAGGGPTSWQQFLGIVAASGITVEEWKSAFASELGVIGDWPANARLPALFAAVAVKDAAKARTIIEAVTKAAPEDEAWRASEKEGVQYYSQAPPNPMVPVSPTIGLSSKLLVVGLDASSVEGAIKRSAAGNSELATAPSFKTAEGWVPAPKQSFTYLDAPLLYQRLDAALRPMLVMAAAFMPGIMETVDLGKLPAAEVITRHLSPLVMSQSYDGTGYVVQSVGPVSIFEAAIGVGIASGAGTAFYQRQMHGNARNPGATLDVPPDEASPAPDESRAIDESATEDAPASTEESPTPAEPQ